MGDKVKPLSEWTLGEIKAECKKHGNKHTGCVFWADGGAVRYCRLEKALDKTYPQAWDLAEPPHWTEQDKEDAKQIRHLLPWAENIYRASEGDLLINSHVSEIHSGLFLFNGLFPSLKPGESATLDDIIKAGGGEE